MEDQPDDSGDLTEDGVDTAAEDAVEEAAEEAAGTEEAAPEQAPAREPSAARKWLGRNRTAVLVGTAAAIFVASGAFAGVALQTYLVDRATVATKQKITRTAADTISTLWTYTPEDMEQLPARSAKYLSGDFQDQYRKFVDAIVATNKQAQVSNSTQVVAAAVESLDGPDASALVYTNTTSTRPGAKVPAMQYVSYRLQLKRKGTDWVVTKMTTITSLDITPKI